jgi:Zn-dependent membrane protease YugP
LTTTGANHGGAGAHDPTTAAAKTAIVLCMGVSMAAATARTLLGLPARFAASRRRVAALLEKLLLSSGENKFLTAVAASK